MSAILSEKSTFPDLIDNLEGNTLSEALRTILKDQSDTSKYNEVCIATAFFTSSGFFQIAQGLMGIDSVRLMIGTEFFQKKSLILKPIGETEKQFHRKQLQENLKISEKRIQEERNYLPFSFESEERIRNFVKALRSGNIEIRRYERDFLHAKAYIFIKEQDGTDGGIVVGSSNMTKSGMTTNLELNVSRSDTPTVFKTKAWFDKLWEDATPFDLADLFEELLTVRTPFEIFIRVLWELYGKEIEADSQTEENLPLTNFQKHGVVRAIRIVEECGGAIVADEVGLGKTFIAGEIIELYKSRRQRALLICPAALRDSTWRKFKSEHEVFIECVSYEELARDEQLNKKPDRVSEKLQRKLDEYQLIIVDEAHNYRNPDSPMRAGILRRLLFGRKKDILLLTATPVNNSLWDLYNLIHFFIKQDSFLAKKGILSLKKVFHEAMQENPSDLNPDKLFPIIDATTVKRTRQFIQKHYKDDSIPGPDGQFQRITFPSPRAKTVRYLLSEIFPFENIEEALDPESSNKILFSRYTPQIYLKNPEEEVQGRVEGIAGLLRSGLLKRFESSLFAFSRTLERMVKQHDLFLKALDKGRVVSTQFLQELSGDDETALEILLDENSNSEDASKYNIDKMKENVKQDLNILLKLKEITDEVIKKKDQKLKVVSKELEKIIKQSEKEGSNVTDRRNKRKILIFSFFADTVEWIFKFLKDEVDQNPKLAEYKGRIAAITGSGHKKESFNPGMSRESAVNGFAPKSMESNHSDDYDILITTDVLAEGVNLQQCCHIINYDLPWNPMRLVQRHGRIDRIGSLHKEVFLRTIFPTDRLDALLNLEQRILDKLALAARSIGVASPIEGEEGGKQVFSETRDEINNLLKENPSLFERGGTVNSTQTGEEYRQTLRKALEEDRDKIINLPWKSGSGMVKGKKQGVFFCATIGEKRTYLRFIPSDEKWKPQKSKKIVKEIGTCLRIIEAERETETVLSEEVGKSVYKFWDIARKDIFDSWMYETDPANLQPRIRKINRDVADFIRSFKPLDLDEQIINKALDIVESPWPGRDEILLREQFKIENENNREKSKTLVNWIIDTGLEPIDPPELLPPILKEDIKLICWLAVTPNSLP